MYLKLVPNKKKEHKLIKSLVLTSKRLITLCHHDALAQSTSY